MSVYNQSLRIALLTSIALSAVFVAPAQAFSDDEARRAILELREQVKRYEDQNRQARLQFADQIQSMQNEMARMRGQRSEEHTSELQSLMRISYAVFCLQKKQHTIHQST